MKNHWLSQRVNLWKIDDGEMIWVVASSEDEALRIYMEEFGFSGYDIEDIDPEFSVCSDDEILTVKTEDGDSVSRTAKEWCLEGKRVVASTVW